MRQSCSSAGKPFPGGWRGWLGLAIVLLAWNGATAYYSSVLTQFMGYDASFYQLLARNRLQGHYEVGDTAHTVRDEGRHPMWRPGLVWVEENLARFLGSVQAASAAASALGITFMELACLWLAWRCFGRPAFFLILAGLFLPVRMGVNFLLLSIRQGPETWAAAALLVGIAALVEALRRGSWGWAILAGAAAGLAEWFRSGNLVLVAVPFGIYGLAALRRRDRRGLALTALAGAAFLGMVVLGGWAVPSSVNKTVANMRDYLREYRGTAVEHIGADGTRTICAVAGLEIAPGTVETYYDYIVRASHSVNTTDYIGKHAGEILPLYGERLMEVLTGGASGLRWIIGDLLLAWFLWSVLIALARPDGTSTHVLALGGGALAHFLGPIVFLRGDLPAHYLHVAAPLFVLAAAAGIVRTGSWVVERARHWQPALALRAWQARRAILAIALAPLACLSFSYYRGALADLAISKHLATQEQADLDALGLEGRNVAAKNMAWFVDRNIHAVLLPYATVDKLEEYARAHAIDGILIWENEPELFLKASPYGFHREMEKPLEARSFFGPPQVSGAWRYFPVRSRLYARREP